MNQVRKKIQNKTATYHEANQFSIEIGEALAKVFQENLSEKQLPNGRMYYNIAKKVVDPMMHQNYDLIAENTSDIQNLLNRQANLSLKAIKPSINQDRIDGIIQRLADSDKFSDIKWILKEPIVNFSQSIIDDSIQENADFQYDSGLKPKIIRRANSGCCEWCSEVAGTYEYSKNMPRDIFRRHRNCNCEVTYHPGDGRRQNIWDKKWNREDEADKISNRVEESERKDINNMFPKNLAGVKRKDMMTFEEADGTKPNPKFNEDYSYKINCQTCVVAYEARRRGYDVEAKGNFPGSLSEMLSRSTNKAWIDPKTGAYPQYIGPGYLSNINTPNRYFDFLHETLKEDTRYTMEFAWKGRNNGGHIVNIFKKNGEITIYDPQTGKTTNEIKKYLSETKMVTTYQGVKYATPPQLLEVENYEFNIEIVNEILRKAGD